MAHQVKVLVTKPDTLSLIPQIHKMGRRELTPPASCPLTHTDTALNVKAEESNKHWHYQCTPKYTLKSMFMLVILPSIIAFLCLNHVSTLN